MLGLLSCLPVVRVLAQEASAAFAESIAGLAPAELLHMGMDSAGSRSLEAFLDSGVSAKAKKRVIRKLASSYARLGNSPGGSHVAQACYRTAVSTALLPMSSFVKWKQMLTACSHAHVSLQKGESCTKHPCKFACILSQQIHAGLALTKPQTLRRGSKTRR